VTFSAAAWGAGPTIAGLAASAVLMTALGIIEHRRTHPLVPCPVTRISARHDASDLGGPF
jgi:hypothetical protein